MGDISKTFRLLDGGLTRALDSAATEQAALASPPRPLRSPAALNVIGASDVIARRPGTGVVVPSTDPLAPVWFISDFASWDLASRYPFGDLMILSETDPDDTDEVLLDWPTARSSDFRPLTWPPRPGTPTAPPSFQLLAPVHGATCQLRAPTFQWSACPGATAYRLYIHTSSRLPYTEEGALNVLALTHRAEIAASSTSYTPANPNLLTQATVYYWWVYAVLDGNKLTRALATPFKFTTKLPAPTGLTTGTVYTLTPTLTWDVNSAAAWVVQIKQGATVIHTSAVLTSATYTVPSAILTSGYAYTYTVTARDVAVGTPGCEVASADTSFNVVATGNSLPLVLTLSHESDTTKRPTNPVTAPWYSGTGWQSYGSSSLSGWRSFVWYYQTTTTPPYTEGRVIQMHIEGGNYVIWCGRAYNWDNVRQGGGYEVTTDPTNWSILLNDGVRITATPYSP